VRSDLVVGDLEVRDDVDLRIAEQLGGHRADERVVAADALLAEEDDLVRRRLDRGGEDAGDAEGVGVGHFALDVDRFRCAAGETLAKRLLHAVRAEGDDGDVAAALLLEADGLFERELVVRRDDELQARFIDAAAVGRDLDARFGIRNLADANNGIQREASSKTGRHSREKAPQRQATAAAAARTSQT
jgi:hypothetical protein